MKYELFDLTNPQKAIWLTEQFYKGQNINNVCGTVLIDSAIDFDKLKEAMNIFIKDNDSFRIHLCISENGDVKQYFNDFSPYDFRIVELASNAELTNLEAQTVEHSFNMIENDLFEIVIFKFPGNNGGFIINANHIVADACTAGLIVSKIINIYSALLANIDNNETGSSYLTYINSENAYLSSSKFLKDKEYWENKFETVPEVGIIPSIKPSSFDSSIAKRELFTLDKNDVQNISNFCSEHKISIFNFFMAIYAIYISRISNNKNFILGTPILNRTTFAEKNTAGMFISTVPFNFSIDDTLSFVNFVSNISKDTLGIFRHQKYPYQSVLEYIRNKDSEQSNLYDILISYQTARTNRNSSDIPYHVHWNFCGNISNSMQIHLYDLNDEGALNIAYDYRVNRYDKTDIDNIHKRIIFMIKNILQNEAISLKNITIVPPDEQNLILNTFNDTYNKFKYSNSIITEIETIANKYPDNIAIKFNTATLTYKELFVRVNKLSNYLLKHKILPNTNIGILTTRTIDTIVGILATLKINCTYVPIDPEYPVDRISYMLSQSNISCILTSTFNYNHKIQNADLTKILIDYDSYSNESSSFNNNFSYDLNNNLYIIFTSGSTGKPKGVTISHKNMLNLIYFEINKTSLFDNSPNTILQFATMSFDVSYQEIFSALLTGSCLVIIEDKTRKNMQLLANYIKDEQVDTLFIPPAYLKILSENDSINNILKSTLKNIITAGETLTITPGISDLIYSGITLYNHYGPAETHVATTYCITKDNLESVPPIGSSISNTKVYILDSNHNLLPISTIGEIAISGDCVGNGYFSNPEMTSQKFIVDKYTNNKMYLTGDLGYYDFSGNLHYIGRSDFQVKINGFRIELGEIDNVLSSNKYISSSKSIIHESNNKKHIITYYVTNDSIDENALLDYLRSSLPLYMIPSKLIQVKKIPINNNGKIDRSKLPAISFIDTSVPMVEPRTKTEINLKNIWENLFNQKNISIDMDFFDLGGDSLLAIKLSSLIFLEFNVNISMQDVFANPTIALLSNIIDIQAKLNYSNIKHISSKEYYPVSSAQKRIFYASKLAGENSVLYNMPGYIIFDKKPDIEKLNSCFKKLIARHSSLRTYFDFIDGRLVQKLSDEIGFNIEIVSEMDDKIEDTVNKFIKPFDLSVAPLLRSYFIFLGNRFVLLFDMHHIISDGLSLSLLATELSKLYNDETLEDLKFDYLDYSNFENKNLNSDYYSDSRDFWINEFSNNPPVLNLPIDKVRPAIKSFEGKRVFKKLSSAFTSQLEDLAKTLNISNFMLLLSCYYILLSKYSNQDDIVIGTPVAGRNRAEFFEIIGMFVNTLPLRIQLDDSMSFSQFVSNVKNYCLKAFDHQMYPYDELVNKLNIAHDSSRNPLFDTVFIYQNTGLPPITFDGISANYYLPDSNVSKFDLSLEVIPTNKNKFKLIFEYCTNLFKTSTIESFANHYINILQQVVDTPDILLKNIELVSPYEKCLITEQFNDSILKYDTNKPLYNLIEEQCKKTPNYTAVVYEDSSITYKELNEKANSLAQHLVSLGISQGDIVGIMLPRSLEILVCILAVWKTGACYIPIDPEFPKSRIKYMLENSNAKLLLCFENTIDFENTLNVNFENTYIYNTKCNNLTVKSHPKDPSYIIYTSGTTGKPKGVMLNHKALSNLTTHLNGYVDYLKNDYGNMAIASITTISFDIFIFETLISLQKGLKVIMANKNEQVTAQLLDNLIFKHDIKAIQMTPSRMNLFMDNISKMPHLNNLKYITLAGEPLPDKLLSDIVKMGEITVYNGYGPSETTVFSTFTDVTKYKKVNIGKPISNTQIYILDKNLNIAPIGVPGELYIAGDGLGIGYINNPTITQERFLPNPFIKDSYFYKTGDLAKYLPNGEISYIGRIDNQIKIRGLRIEPDEIEKLILKFPGVLKTIVSPKSDHSGRDFLISYLVVDEKISISNLRSYLSSNLPRYMIPSYFMILDKLPYLPNGKIDKKSLPLPDLSVFDKKEDYNAPSTPLEEQIAIVFEKILGIPQISVTDNFFELGGDSLLAMSLQIELMKISDSITYSDIFLYPTIKGLASKISKSIKESKLVTNNLRDFSEFDNILEKNNILKSPLKESPCGNILLTGVTGFLGAHVLDAYLQAYPENKVYCLIRNEHGLTLENKLLKKLHFYFGDKYDHLINKQIIIFKGDISKNNLGINDDILENIYPNVTHVINCAANVSHFGNSDAFIKSNVKGTQNIVDFCKTYDKKLYHISTTSVSGNGFASGTYIKQDFSNDIIFKENHFYIKQSLDNLYVKSKFDAESIILSAINDGLDAYILRIGNLMARISDTKFQKNAEQNAYINRLLTFAKLKYIPDYLLETYAEFTPVDSCAQSIIKLIQYPSKNNRIFHLYNHHHVTTEYLLDALSSYIKIDVISSEEFIKRIDKILTSPDSRELLSGILSDLGPDKILNYNTNIKIDSDFSINYLQSIGFSWPTITKDYLVNFLKKLVKGE